MRDKFLTWFHKVHPGMEIGGWTARDEWLIWSEGYTAGQERTIEIYEGKEVTGTKKEATGTKIEGVCGL